MTNNNLDYDLISSFINQNIKPPDEKVNFSLDYILIKRNQVSKLRNRGNLDEASAENEILEKYIDKLDKNS